MAEVGVGIIGAGAYARQHARAIADLDGVTLVAASARNRERLAAFTGDHGGTGYRDYAELLLDPAVDVVCVVLPNALHGEATFAAARAGKAILIEKPMAATMADCDAIVDVVAQTGVPFMVAHPSRYMPSYVEARRLVSGGEIGEPVVCTATMAKAWTFEQRRPWHLVEGGGMWLNNGVHLIDRLAWLIDSLPREVHAHVGTRFHVQEADDVGVGMITFESGAVGLVRAVGYRGGAEDQWTELHGTKGALRVSHTEGLWIARGDRWQLVGPPDPDQPLSSLRPLWQAFLRYVENGGPSPIPAGYGRCMVATILAGRRSSETGRVVPIA